MKKTEKLIMYPKTDRTLNTVYTRVEVERVYKSNPIFEAKKYNFFRKSLIF